MNPSKVLSSLSYRGSYLTSRISERLVNIYNDKQMKLAGASNAKHVFTHMTRRELNALFNIASGCGTNAYVLEIGSYLGASSCYLAAALSRNSGHLICVDTWQNQTMPDGERDTLAEFKKNIRGLESHVTMVRKMSSELDDTDISQPLKLAFIDGDHSYSAVRGDYEKAAKWLVKDGILAFHDCIGFEGVSKVIGEALASGSWRLQGHVDNLLWLRKVVGS